MTSYSQTKLESVGIATMSVIPDQGILSLSFSVLKPEIRVAVETLNNQIKEITEQFSRLEIKDYNQRNFNFSINVNRIYNPTGKYKDSGYVAHQQIFIEFKNSTGNISKILNSFPLNLKNGHFRFIFQASDTLRKSVASKLIELATQNAIEKAQVMASSAKLSLGKIIEIKHGAFPIDGYLRTESMIDEHEIIAGGVTNGVQETGIRFTDRVEIIFELNNREIKK